MNYALLTLMILILIAIIVLLYKMAKTDDYKRNRTRELKLDSVLATVDELVEAACNEDLSDSAFAYLPQSEIDHLEELREELRKAKLECATGDPSQKIIMVNKIGKILTTDCGVTAKNICEIIPFDDPYKMTAQDKFELMYAAYKKQHSSYTFKYMDEDFGFFNVKTRDDGRKYYEVTAEDIEEAYDKFSLNVDFVIQLNCLTQRVYQTLYGHHVADIFTTDYSFDDIEGGVGGRLRNDFDYHEEIRDRDEDETEGNETPKHGRQKKSDSYDKADERAMYYDVLSVKYMGKIARLSFLSFGTAEKLSKVVDRIYLNNPKEVLCELTPKVQSKLKDPGESRVMVVCPPEANKSFYVRHPASNKRIDLDELITWDGCAIVKKILIALVKGEFNIYITGNTGGGKTTLIKSLVEYLDPSYEIRTVESEAELNLNNIYPDKNVHALVESEARDIYECIKDTKKMNTDVLIIGEVDSPKLAGAVIQASQSGSAMTMTTMHLMTTDKCFAYMRNALVKEENITDVQVASHQVLDAFNFDVRQVHDTDGNRYIEHISEVVPVEYDEYSADPTENEKQYHERVTDRKMYEVNRIIEFDKTTMSYHVVGNFSARSLERLVEKIGIAATKELKKSLDDLKVDRIDYKKMLSESLDDEEQVSSIGLAAARSEAG